MAGSLSDENARRVGIDPAGLHGEGLLLPEEDLFLSDVLTNNVSSSKHGFMPKFTGKAYETLQQDGSIQLLTPLILYKKNIAILTSGSPSDLTTIVIPATITRWRAPGEAGISGHSFIMTETSSGT